ncbi:Rossmann-fold NAD(P)-binding domain-containing protein [Parapedobacter deserti]
MMNVLIVGCGWVGTYVATHLLEEGHRIWATCTSIAKAEQLAQCGLMSHVVDFDVADGYPDVSGTVFDLVVVSVPITRRDARDVVERRFDRLCAFLNRLSFRQSIFFGSVGIYPKVSAVITEDTFAADELDDKLFRGESMLRSAFPDINILRLGGLFGLERVIAKHFAGKVCEIGSETANFVHVEDVYGIIRSMLMQGSRRKTYNVVCPEHPLKREVIEVSAVKYGYGLPAAFVDNHRTAKVVSPDRLLADLGYRFIYRSPLHF